MKLFIDCWIVVHFFLLILSVFLVFFVHGKFSIDSQCLQKLASELTEIEVKDRKALCIVSICVFGLGRVENKKKEIHSCMCDRFLMRKKRKNTIFFEIQKFSFFSMFILPVQEILQDCHFPHKLLLSCLSDRTYRDTFRDRWK